MRRLALSNKYLFFYCNACRPSWSYWFGCILHVYSVFGQHRKTVYLLRKLVYGLWGFLICRMSESLKGFLHRQYFLTMAIIEPFYYEFYGHSELNLECNCSSRDKAYVYVLVGQNGSGIAMNCTRYHCPKTGETEQSKGNFVAGMSNEERLVYEWLVRQKEKAWLRHADVAHCKAVLCVVFYNGDHSVWSNGTV